MIARDENECRGRTFITGTWYCATHGIMYVAPELVREAHRTYRRLGDEALCKRIFENIGWPWTSVPIRNVVLVPGRPVMPQANDFGTVVHMFRWMDARGLRKGGGK